LLGCSYPSWPGQGTAAPSVWRANEIFTTETLPALPAPGAGTGGGLGQGDTESFFITYLSVSVTQWFDFDLFGSPGYHFAVNSIVQ